MAKIPAPEREAYDALQCYTLTLGDRTFIHQHVVDAWAAQHADEPTKPIAWTFALVGLFLHLERGFTGREVQLAHIALARRKTDWPAVALPRQRGSMTAIDVMNVPPGSERGRAIDAWCASVWEAFNGARGEIAEWLERHGIKGGSHP